MSDPEQIPASDILKEAAEYLCKLGSNLRIRSESLKDKRISKDKLKNSHAILKTVDKILLICELSKKSLSNVEEGVKKVMNAFSKNRSKQERVKPVPDTKGISKHYIQYGSHKFRINRKINFNHYKSAKVHIRKMSILDMLNYPVHYNCKLKSMQHKKLSDISSNLIDRKPSVEGISSDSSVIASKTKNITLDESESDSSRIKTEKSTKKIITADEKEEKKNYKKLGPLSKRPRDSDTDSSSKTKPVQKSHSKTKNVISDESDSNSTKKTTKESFHMSKTTYEEENKKKNYKMLGPLSRRSHKSNTDSSNQKTTVNRIQDSSDSDVVVLDSNLNKSVESEKKNENNHKEVKISDNSSNDENQDKKTQKKSSDKNYDVKTEKDINNTHHSSDSESRQSMKKENDKEDDQSDANSNSSSQKPALKCIDITKLLKSPLKNQPSKPKKVQFNSEVIDISLYEKEKIQQERERKLKQKQEREEMQRKKKEENEKLEEEKEKRFWEVKRQEVLKFEAKSFTVNVCKLPEYTEDFLKEHNLNRITCSNIVLISIRKSTEIVPSEHENSDTFGSNSPKAKRSRLDKKNDKSAQSSSDEDKIKAVDKIKRALLDDSSSENDTAKKCSENSNKDSSDSSNSRKKINSSSKKHKLCVIDSSSDNESKTKDNSDIDSTTVTKESESSKRHNIDSSSDGENNNRSNSNEAENSITNKHSSDSCENDSKTKIKPKRLKIKIIGDKSSVEKPKKRFSIYSSSDDDEGTNTVSKETKESGNEHENNELSENERESREMNEKKRTSGSKSDNELKTKSRLNQEAENSCAAENTEQNDIENNPSKKDNPENDHSTKETKENDPSTKDNEENNPSTKDDEECDTSTKDNEENDPSTKDTEENIPSLTNNLEDENNEAKDDPVEENHESSNSNSKNCKGTEKNECEESVNANENSVYDGKAQADATTPTKKSGSNSSQSTPQSKRKQIMETMEAKRMLLTDSSSDSEDEKQRKARDAIKKALLTMPDDSDSEKETSKRKISSSSDEDDDIITKVRRRRKKIKRDERRSKSSGPKDGSISGDGGSSSTEKKRKMGRSRVKPSSSDGQNTDAKDSDKSIEGLTKLDTLHKQRSRKKASASTSNDESQNGTRRSKRTIKHKYIGTDVMLEADSKSESSAEEAAAEIEDDDELPAVELGMNGDSVMEDLAKTDLLEESHESSSDHESHHDSANDNNDDNDEENNEDGSDEDFKEKVKTKRRKAVVNSDSDGGRKGDSDFEESDVDSSEPVKRKRKKKISDESDASAGSSSSANGKKKRRRIKQVNESDGSGSGSENEGRKHGRKNIRKVMGKNQLEEATKKAAREEKERIARITERQKLYNNLEFDETGKPDEVIPDKVILDFDPETKEPLIEVDRGLVKKLKPHQANGIKFMWNACFESVKRIKKDRGSGCILAHCMGLGKTLQVVSLVHTLLTHSKLTKTNRVLVVCPLSTVLNWVNEFNMWLKHAHNDTEIDIYELSRYKQNSERAFQLQQWFSGGGVCVLGYEMFRNLSADNTKKFRKKMLNSFQQSLVEPGPDLVVCDEGHLLKNEKTSLSQSMNRVRTRRRIVLTGTPLQNNLKEYYCMVQFVKPNLLGKYNEYLNRFVNPITNGQYTDSTEHDIKIMKRRSHVLHKMLDGAVQRRDYGVLAPFLPPKHEYVLFITLTEVQIKLYQHYLDNYSRRPSAGKSSGFLFPDFQSLQRIWTHPLVLKYNSERYEIMQQKKREREEEEDSEGSLVNFIDDDSTPEETSTDESSDDLSDLSDDSVKKNKKKKNSKKKNRDTKATARRGTRANPNEVDDIEIKNLSDIEEVKNDNPTEWWMQLVTDDELEDMRHSSKLVLLFDILRQCEAIGDKLLVFSQSLYSLDLIEHFLGKVDEATQEGRIDEKLCGHVGSWSPGMDYFRLDGSTSCENRSIWCKNFNKEDNPRARSIYKFHEHDSLLENKEEETLSEEERKAAWEDFENEKNRPPPPAFNAWGINGMAAAGLMAQQQQMAYAALAQMLRKDMPTLTEDQIRNMLPMIYNANPALMQKMNDIYKYAQPGLMNPGMMNPMMNAASSVSGGSSTSSIQYEPPWQRQQQMQQQQRLQQLMQQQSLGAKYYAGGLGSRDPVAMAQQQQLARQLLLGDTQRARGRPPLQAAPQQLGDVVNLDSD